MQKNILQIALDLPLDRLFDYLDSGFQVQIGQRVLVPFGARKVVGVVVGITDTSDFAIEKLKAITQVFDDEPPLDADTFALLRFCADYYQYPFGQALLASLPTRLTQAANVMAKTTRAVQTNRSLMASEAQAGSTRLGAMPFCCPTQACPTYRPTRSSTRQRPHCQQAAPASCNCWN